MGAVCTAGSDAAAGQGVQRRLPKRVELGNSQLLNLNYVLSIFIIIYSYSIFTYIIFGGISNDSYLIIVYMFILIEVAETDFYGEKVTSDFTAL